MTLALMVKPLALGMVMMTLGEKANVVEEMAIHGVNVTLVRIIKQFDMGIVMMTLGEKANLRRL